MEAEKEPWRARAGSGERERKLSQIEVEGRRGGRSGARAKRRGSAGGKKKKSRGEGEEPESGGTDWGSGEKLFTVSF